MAVIGYYIHHVGQGHLARATAIAQALVDRGEQVMALSTLPEPSTWPGGWIHLADDRDLPTESADARSADADGALHFAPVGEHGFARRQRQIATWVTTAHPAAVVVDVSVEVTTLVRLLGVRVVVVAMPGERTDRPHRLGYVVASAIVACWPPGAHPDHLTSIPPLAGRTHWVGGISRFEGTANSASEPSAAGDPKALPRNPPIQDTGTPRRAEGLVLWGQGSGAPRDDQLAALREATPHVVWRVAFGLPSDEAWRALLASDLVVTHAGQGAVADVAAAHLPAVVIAQPRPHDEQLATTRALARLELAATAVGWPSGEQWSELLAQARHIGGQGWQRWLGGGAAEAAQVVQQVALDPGKGGR